MSPETKLALLLGIFVGLVIRALYVRHRRRLAQREAAKREMARSAARIPDPYPQPAPRAHAVSYAGLRAHCWCGQEHRS